MVTYRRTPNVQPSLNVRISGLGGPASVARVSQLTKGDRKQGWLRPESQMPVKEHGFVWKLVSARGLGQKGFDIIFAAEEKRTRMHVRRWGDSYSFGTESGGYNMTHTSEKQTGPGTIGLFILRCLEERLVGLTIPEKRGNLHITQHYKLGPPM